MELSLTPWTRGEVSILQHPDFRREYVKMRPAGPPPVNTLRNIAARLGAERVFQHDYPGRYYLLAVFKRHRVTD